MRFRQRMQSIKRILKIVIKEYLRDFYWHLRGKSFYSKTSPPAARSFLFICKGNICRSAFAHYQAEKISEEIMADKAFKVASAGIEVSNPEQPPQEAVTAAANFGISMDRHQSKAISAELCRHADMILVMEAWQLKAVRSRFPQYNDRVYLLSQFDRNDFQDEYGWHKYNIMDPYGKGEIEFHRCFKRIKACINTLFEQVT